MKEENTNSHQSMIEFTELEQIKAFVYLHESIHTKQEAQTVIDTLLSCRETWKNVHGEWMDGRFLYVDIHYRLSDAFQILGQFGEAINCLMYCIKVVETSGDYKYLYQVKADLYSCIAKLKCDLGAYEDAKEDFKNSVYYQFVQYNHTHYDRFEFYSFRKVNEYSISNLEHNTITLANPTSFNDPLDPALTAHFDWQIANNCRNEKEKRFLQLQQEVYGLVRIRCFTRALSLPLREGRDVSPLNPDQKEINITTMWGHYAENHKGICIKYVFPKELTEKNIENDAVRIIHEVDYLKEYNPQSTSFNIDHAFFAKSNFWEYEHEHRILYFNRNSEENYPDITISPECITDIFLGLRISEEDKQKVINAINDKPHIRLHQMVLSNDNIYLLKSVELKRDIPSDKNGCCIGKCIKTIKEKIKKVIN